jgi:uncharacterized SAM-binding protein YcdF (DUF218 family)
MIRREEQKKHKYLLMAIQRRIKLYKKIYTLVFLIIIITILILASVNMKQYNNDLKTINCSPTVEDISVNTNNGLSTVF